MTHTLANTPAPTSEPRADFFSTTSGAAPAATAAPAGRESRGVKGTSNAVTTTETGAASSPASLKKPPPPVIP
jgi:hypothetical protein